MKHRTSFETVAPAYLSCPRYVPTCSCGFRGAAVNTAAAALTAANAHARARGAEPQPPPPDELRPNWRQRVSRMATPWPGRAPAGWWLIHKHAWWLAVFVTFAAGLVWGFLIGVLVA